MFESVYVLTHTHRMLMLSINQGPWLRIYNVQFPLSTLSWWYTLLVFRGYPFNKVQLRRFMGLNNKAILDVVIRRHNEHVHLMVAWKPPYRRGIPLHKIFRCSETHPHLHDGRSYLKKYGNVKTLKNKNCALTGKTKGVQCAPIMESVTTTIV